MTRSAIPSVTIDEVDESALIAFAQALVQADSVYDPASGRTEAAAATVVAEQMHAFGWHPTIDEVAPARPNVVAVVDGGAPGPTLLFEGHTDVVTVGAPEEWSVDPFGAEIRNGRLYGRGAADMKAGVAAMLFAANLVQRRGPFPGRIVLAALVDEEGLMLGVKRFCATAIAHEIDAAIICEPEGSEICIAQKGALRLRLDAVGKMAHGAMPQHGINPVPALASFISAVTMFEGELQEQHDIHPLLGSIYLTPTAMRAGEELQMNVIPGDAWVAVDIRTTPAVRHLAIIERLRQMAQDISDATGVILKLSVIDDRSPTEVSSHEPVVRAIAAAHEAFLGTTAEYGGVPGTTDGTILSRELGIPVVVYGPGGKWIAHQVDEWVAVEELARYAAVYGDAALRYLNSSVES
jgi:succinyl-diaminopimelate desuccinylase